MCVLLRKKFIFFHGLLGVATDYFPKMFVLLVFSPSELCCMEH